MPLTFESFGPASGTLRHLVFLLHGLGSNAEDLIGLAPMLAEAAPDALFISPNAPFPCDMVPIGYPNSYQWFSLQSWDIMDMTRGAERVSSLLNEFIDAQLAVHSLTNDCLVLAGFSQGAMMSLHVGLRRVPAIAGILGFSGALLDSPDLGQQITSRPPICLIHGVMDPVVPYSAMSYATERLKSLDCPVESYSRPLLAHSIDQEGIAIGQDFLRKTLL